MTKHVIWQDQEMWRDYLQDSHDQQVQGESFEELQFKLRHLSRERAVDEPSNLRKIA